MSRSRTSLLMTNGHKDLIRNLALRVLRGPIASVADRDRVSGMLCECDMPGDIDLAVVTLLNNPWLSPADQLAVAAL